MMPPVRAAGLVLLLTACSAPDYRPVRDWAGTASQAADYPSMVAACTPAAADARTLDALRASQDDALRAMQTALAAWLSALGTLAADGVLPYREDPFVQLAQRAGATSQPGGQAIAALGALLRRATLGNAQAPELGATISAGDPSVQALITALREAVRDSGARLAEARSVTAAAYGGLERELQLTAPRAAPRTGAARPSRDEAARRLLRDVAQLRERDFALAAVARADYDQVLHRIGEGHALLASRSGRLSQEETARQVSAAEDALRRTAWRLPRVMAPPPEGIACVGAPPAASPPGTATRTEG
jgi:hypothetical protein